MKKVLSWVFDKSIQLILLFEIVLLVIAFILFSPFIWIISKMVEPSD